MVVIGAEEDESSLDLDSFLPKDAKSWLRTQEEIEVKKPAVVCGKLFLKPIGQAIATPIFGKRTRR